MNSSKPPNTQFTIIKDQKVGSPQISEAGARYFWHEK